jgi:GT2 family glycosyltransferase
MSAHKFPERSQHYPLTVSIVAFKTPVEELTIAISSCLASSPRTRFILVDNSPVDSLAATCRELGVTYIKTASNLGFGAAHNIALRIGADSNYHLVMNADVRFTPDVLKELIEFLDLNPSVGLVMPRILYPDGSSQHMCKRLPDPFDILVRRLLPKALQLRLLGSPSVLELGDMDMQKVLSVPYLSGCFMMLRNSVLAATGLFDEKYFMYFEDLDLSRRIHQRCHTVYYPAVSITHNHGRGSYKSAWLFLCGIRSAIRYFQKWGWFGDEDRDAFNRAVGPLQHLRSPHVRADGACS